jgi:hypothetical protein
METEKKNKLTVDNFNTSWRLKKTNKQLITLTLPRD